MNTIYKYFTLLLFAGTLLTSCNSGQNEKVEIERPNDPWVFRSVLDAKPRMITLALNENLWAAYSTQNSSLYKVWKGVVNFDGAVYTTLHGPQPLSVGNAYFVNQYEKPWIVIENGKEMSPEVSYKGHRFKNGHVELMYQLGWNGKKVMVYERPEYVEAVDRLTGFERIYNTENVPEGTQIALMTNVGSVAMKSNVETDGDFQIREEEPREAGSISAIDLKGKLVLKSNAPTRFMVQFVKKPLIENPNESLFGEDEDEDTPEGFNLIAKSDCKTCHNTFKKTIGPAYMDVAKRYANSEENIILLTSKVKNGGYGVWGSQVMSAHPNDSDEDIRKMVEYILTLDAEEEAANASSEENQAPEESDYVFAAENIVDNEMLPGAVARVYFHDKDLAKLADINSKQAPAYVDVLKSINIMDADFSGMPDNFALIAEGFLKIDKSGNYFFRLTSDDGSSFSIGETKLIDNDGLHGADAVDGVIALKEGYHPFKLKYFQGKGGKNVSLKWRSGGGGEYVVVPATNLVHNKKERPDVLKPMALSNEAQVPGDGTALRDVHPSYDLSQARPNDFLPKVGGMDFLSDGRMVVSTWDAAGSVFILDGVQSGDPSKITVKTIAKGFAEPLGLKVVDDEIYVLQKQELTKLVDNDGDDIADEYLTVCNGWKVSANFHEFAFGLVYKDDYFYATLATAINPGGASTQPQIPDRGKVVKISKETGEFELIASGLRTPNGIGIGVDNEIFVADNQGDWLPASKIVHVKPDAWYGSRSVDFEGTANLKETLPVVWLPQDEIGNSPSTPIYLNDGPYKGQMIHGEVTNGGVKRVFVEKVNGDYQGCVFRFTQGLEAGVNRIIWGPDGALYIGGIGSTGNWVHTGKLWYGLQRLKYNEKPTFEMLAVHAKTNGVEIEFTEPLKEGDGWKASDYQIKQWYYLPTEEYGGPKLDLKDLKILSVNVSDDRKKVFLELDGMKSNHMVYVKLQTAFISANDNELWTTEAWYTMNQIPKNQPGTKTTAPILAPVNTLSDAEKAAGWMLLFNGKSFDGWKGYNKDKVSDIWRIEDEAMTIGGETRFINKDGNSEITGSHDILTVGQYDNFELHLEWRIQNCGNSGIFYLVSESDKYAEAYYTGIEMQVLDNVCHRDGKIRKHRAGDLYDMIECKFETVKPAGEWNQVRLRVNNGHVEHWLNGYKVVEYQLWNNDWKNMVANSKFKDWEDFGTAKKGHIALQEHDDRVWYRNIKIKELKGETN